MELRHKSKWSVDPVFTLFQERPGYICGQTTFIEIGDPTGYLWALKYLGDYTHFLKLMGTSWFPEVFQKWQEALEVKLKAEALVRIQEIAKSGTTQSLAAAKFLAEAGWKEKATKGRPSKSMLDQELKRMSKDVLQQTEDAERIGLVVVQGGAN